jgi:predicted membrane protein
MISTSTKIVLGVLAVLLIGFVLLPSWLKWVLIVIALVGLAVYQFYSDRVRVITNKIKQDVKTDFAKTKPVAGSKAGTPATSM